MRDFSAFRRKVETDFFAHPVVTANPYTAWFKTGVASTAQVVDLVEQFSVFSNHFLAVQAKRLVNAATEEGERCARNILMNECGVGLDPRSGSVEGRTFSTANAHINWLRELGLELGLDPRRLGRWELGTRSTRRFLEGLDRTYGSRDPQVGAGASFAIETWAASGLGQGPEFESRNFWRELIAGLEGHSRLEREAHGLKALPLGFFRFHAEIEAGHGANVWRELAESFAGEGFDAARFLRGGRRALAAIQLFWTGLDEARKGLGAREEWSLAGVNPAQWAV